MKKIAYLLIVLLTLLMACDDKKQQYEHSTYFALDDFQDMGLISHEASNLDSVFRPLVICNSDSVLIISDTGTDYYIQCYNKKDGKKLCEFLPWGNGPNEMNYITDIQDCGDSLFVYNSQQNKYMIFDKTNLTSFDNISPKKSTTIKDAPIVRALILPRGNILAYSLNPEPHLLSMYNADNQLLEIKGGYPDDKQEYPSDFAKKKAFDCEIGVDFHNQKIVVCYKLTDLIEIYDLSLNLIKRIQGPDYFFPIVDQSTDGEYTSAGAIFGKSIEAYGRPVIIENEIWVLYSGDIMDSKPNDYLRDKLFVFDFNGIPLRQYKLDVPILRFAVDPVENKIYAITDIPDFRIVTFQL